MIHKVLVANRGEIALRIIRACRELGLKTIAVHSEADSDALHVRFADEALCIGPASAKQSYLNIPALISAAEVGAADAIHPGYGFLAESAAFAETCAKCGFKFIGPKPEAMRLLGDKIRAREHMIRQGVPVLPGTGCLGSAEEARKAANEIGYPVIIKAAGGGGGRGMRVVREEENLEREFLQARAEAESGFKNPDVFLERFVERPRHVEIQVVADEHGRVAHLGERECSIQRRHQKLVEEAPSIVVTPEKRAEIGDLVVRAFREAGYTSLATVEFLVDEELDFYFMEVNTRVQVEHPVTEMVTGVDLVALQLRIASGDDLALPPGGIVPRGWAMECRINAEDPDTFAPSPGLVTEYYTPGGTGVRVDSGIYGGWRVPQHYDSLLAKLIVHGPDRATAIARMRSALSEFIITGIKTNVPFHQRLFADPEFVAGRIDTGFVARRLETAR